MKAGKLYVNGKLEKTIGDQEKQHAYFVETTQMLDVPALFDEYGFLPVREGQTANGYQYQFQGLTDKIATDFRKMPVVKSVTQDIRPQNESEIAHYYVKENGVPVAISNKVDTTNTIFPFGKKWNVDWYGPLKIPKKGDVVEINKETLPEYRWIISEYEHNHLEEENGKIFINGKKTDKYTIKQDYYMMIGDNRDASLDARFFGFVPEENIIGKPMFTWMSLQGTFKDEFSMYQPKFKVRWNRMFKATNTGEAHKTSYWWVAVLILVLFFGWDYFAKFFRKKK
jgi:signal peptidase I